MVIIRSATQKDLTSFSDVELSKLILVYKNRKEMIVETNDEVIVEKIKKHLSNAPTFFPTVKYLTDFFKVNNIPFEVKETPKGLKV